MTTVRSAAVPHYSKANGKIVFAVRVCPSAPSVEPFTVYRRWDEFLDFSAKLSITFPSIEKTDSASQFKRIPRLSRKVTLFATASTHASRRDQLDLFVRHLFNMPKIVITSELVTDFFSCKANGLDGRSPPSPAPTHQSQFGAAPGAPITKEARYATVSPATSPFTLSEQDPASPYTASKTSREATLNAAVWALPMQNFKPLLSAKRSTPDLRRFVSMREPSEEDHTPLPQSSDSFPYPAQLNFKFPRTPPPVPPISSSLGRPPASNDTPETDVDTPGVDNDETIRFSVVSAVSSCAPPVPPKPAIHQRTGLAIDTFDDPTAHRQPSALATSPSSHSLSSSNSDGFSLRTASTVRPGRNGRASRVTSPVSFVSYVSDDASSVLAVEAMSPPKVRPSPGVLKQFRSLQDLRAVITPHPQLPNLDGAIRSSSIRSQASRSRSNSRTLDDVLEHSSETAPVSPHAPSASVASSTSNASVSGGRQPIPFDTHGTPCRQPTTTRPLPKFHRPSLNNLRRFANMPIQSLPQTPTNETRKPSQHQATGSSSSIDSFGSSESSGHPLSCSHSSSNDSSTGSGLGLDFSFSSRESLEFSDQSSISLHSPDSTHVQYMSSPFASAPHGQDSSGPSTPSSSSQQHYPTNPYPLLPSLHEPKFEKWQHDAGNGGYVYNNHIPPMPFFPTPQSADMAYTSVSMSKRSSRNRTSSLHTPVLETILASPILGDYRPGETQPGATDSVDGADQGAGTTKSAAFPAITIKVMLGASNGNFMLKVSKTCTLAETKTKIQEKCEKSNLDISEDFSLGLATSSTGLHGTIGGTERASSKGSDGDTSIASDCSSSSSNVSSTSSLETVIIEDEADWQTTIRLATNKITLRVL